MVLRTVRLVVLRSSLSWLVTVNLGFIVAISSLEPRVNGGYKSTVKWGVTPCAYLNVEVLCQYIYIYVHILPGSSNLCLGQFPS